MQDRFAATLKASGASLTAARRTIFEALAQGGPVTTSALATSCAPKVDRATVYRTIELFESLGVINRIWHGFKSQIELSEIFTPHHHHAVCQQCGTTIDVINRDIERLLAQIAKTYEFLTLSHIIELNGYCVKCQQK